MFYVLKTCLFPQLPNSLASSLKFTTATPANAWHTAALNHHSMNHTDDSSPPHSQHHQHEQQPHHLHWQPQQSHNTASSSPASLSPKAISLHAAAAAQTRDLYSELGMIDSGMRELELRLESDLEEWDADSSRAVVANAAVPMQQQKPSSVRH